MDARCVHRCCKSSTDDQPAILPTITCLCFLQCELIGCLHVCCHHRCDPPAPSYMSCSISTLCVGHHDSVYCAYLVAVVHQHFKCTIALQSGVAQPQDAVPDSCLWLRRVPAFSAQQAATQLGHAAQPLVRRMHSKLSVMTTYDAALSSWQDLYRSVSWLDFGSGLATGITALQRVRSRLLTLHKPGSSHDFSVPQAFSDTLVWECNTCLHCTASAEGLVHQPCCCKHGDQHFVRTFLTHTKTFQSTHLSCLAKYCIVTRCWQKP